MKLFDKYLKRVYDEEGGAMPGTTTGGPNAPMSTETIGQPKNYVGTRQKDKRVKGKKKKKPVNQQQASSPTNKLSPAGFLPMMQRKPVL